MLEIEIEQRNFRDGTLIDSFTVSMPVVPRKGECLCLTSVDLVVTGVEYTFRNKSHEFVGITVHAIEASRGC